jgi:thymidine kinase
MLGIDEAQFLTMKSVRVCNDLANQGIRVIVQGWIWTSGNFGPMPALILQNT